MIHPARQSAKKKCIIIYVVIGLVAVAAALLLWLGFLSPRHHRMQAALADLQRQNQADTTFHSDSLQRRLADYFDLWGTDNERLLAHYLLGRAHADMGDAPAAVEDYNKALTYADNKDAEHDSNTLRGLFGQLATLYHNMDMPDDEIMAWKMYRSYSLELEDTLSADISYYYMTGAYHTKRDTAKILALTDKAYTELMKHGFQSEAAAVYPTAIHILLMQGETAEAGRRMQIFETQSGIMGPDGKIKPGCEEYYVSKGLYCLEMGGLSQAETLFRMALAYGHREEAYYGLLRLYEELDISDSIIRYATLYANANDERNLSRNAHDVIMADKSFSFRRHKQQAQSALKRLKLLSGGTVLLLIIVAAGYYSIRRLSRMVKTSKRRLMLKDTLISNVITDIETIKKRMSSQEKQNAILSSHLKQMTDKNTKLTEQLNMQRLFHLPIVEKFRAKSQGVENPPPATQKDWDELEAAFINTHVKFASDMQSLLTVFEKRVCMLVAIGIPNARQAVMLSSSVNSVTNANAGIHSKMFGKEGAKGLQEDIQGLLMS